MALLLFIETSSINCSVAIFNDSQLLALIEKQETNVHASSITLFIEEATKKANISLSQLDAIAVGKGPGSYTGLRIGVSTAKGLCYALNKPLIACNSLRSLFEQAKSLENNPTPLYIPLIDARRMEVYTCQFNYNAELIEDIDAVILDEHSFVKKSEDFEIIFFGDGVEKTKVFFENNSRVKFIDNLYPSAKYMLSEALDRYSNNQFEDVAYFEPFYLKEFYFKK